MGIKFFIKFIFSQAKVNETLKFANRLKVKNEVEEQLKNLTVNNNGSSAQKKSNKQSGGASSSSSQATPFSYASLFSDAEKFHKVGENYKTDAYKITPSTMTLLGEHLKRTGSNIVTRFPPEPSGILHIGHVKAINLDFGLAKHFSGGKTYLRFDDTNPETEEQRFMDEITSNVEWLGYSPYQITHSSDYFDKLHECALKMIRLNLAYVCHMTKDQLKDRDIGESPYRNRSVEENLAIFEQMRQGAFNEGEATLRLKFTMDDGKVDPVAYRINYTAHPRTGNKWCIYPSYDFSHPVVDSLEDITHSMCSKEFQSHRYLGVDFFFGFFL